MSSQLLYFALPPAVALVAGLALTFLGFRAPKANPPPKLRGALRIAGPLLLFAALAWLLVTPPPDGWTRHRTSDGACSAEFPRPPQHELNPDGEEADRLAVSFEGRQTRYSLTFSDLSAKDAARPLDEVFSDLSEIFATARTPGGVPARRVKEVVLSEHGVPGREYLFTVGGQLTTRIKVFVRGARVYRAIAVTPADAALDRDAQRFIDSFRFEPTAP